jgi:hypothetical protein
MTSAVSREDVEGELWKLAGRVDPWRIERVMRLIDKYSISVSRKYAPIWGVEELPPPTLSEVYPDLLPGQQDIGKNIARCCECEKVKKLPYNFNLDRTRKVGFQRICRACAGKHREKKPAPEPDFKITCAKCGETKIAQGNYYRREKNTTGYDSVCKDCTDYRQACLVCFARRHKNEYAKHPDQRPVCDTCRTKNPSAAIWLHTYYCRGCRIDKWLEEFPEDKRFNVHAQYSCLECAASNAA